MAKLTFTEILADLRKFETIHFRTDRDAADALKTMVYDALVALLTKLASESPAEPPMKK